MTDREKVIRGLECCERPYEKKCDACPYIFHAPDSMECTAYLCKDALELLREQEPAKPITQDAWPNPVMACGSCGGYITYTAGRPRYCPNCGCEMKWDE